jgi:hypothetical protein
VAFADEKRSYVIVANTVQTQLISEPWLRTSDTVPVRKLITSEHTRSVLQPDGRQIAQACHATARMMEHLLEQVWREALLAKQPWPQLGPLTRIILAARDSFELEHVRALLASVKIAVFDFEDTNAEAYGEGVSVRTAIATAPVYASDVVGLINYLPLWTPSII